VVISSSVDVPARGAHLWEEYQRRASPFRRRISTRRFLPEGVQRGGVQTVRVQRGEHGEPQFPVQDGYAADRVLGAGPFEVENGLAAGRDGRVLQRERLQERHDGRLVHDRLVHGPIPVRQGRMLRRVRVPVHVFDVAGKSASDARVRQPSAEQRPVDRSVGVPNARAARTLNIIAAVTRNCLYARPRLLTDGRVVL